MSALSANAVDLERELTWFNSVLESRFRSYFGDSGNNRGSPPGDPPDLTRSSSPYARLVIDAGIDLPERVALLLALVPHVRPQLLDVFFTKNATFDCRFSEFGGEWERPDGRFLPTGDTLAFILGGADLATRFEVQMMLGPDGSLSRRGIVELAADSRGERSMLSRLVLSEACLSLATTGQPHRPHFGAGFPARRITTELTWDDLVLHPGTLRQIDDVGAWLRHGDALMVDWGMHSKLRPGHRALFHGPPGTGKTMTACLLGKYTGRDVYGVDLSLVVSKYIGETEKNLARIFDQAQHQGWILFFDEADALFGKRSETKDAHDRYANQEVAYLLQRIETFDGVAILASNRRTELDEAFTRRFETVIHFPLPRPEDRRRLWRHAFSPKSDLATDVDMAKVAADHALSGGSIMNVVRSASLDALAADTTTISSEMIERAIRHELSKEGQRV